MLSDFDNVKTGSIPPNAVCDVLLFYQLCNIVDILYPVRIKNMTGGNLNATMAED
jgi:hypothetical protein